jgi:NAD(P)-dependent dehydrogenase (short-subunit alcohol dehydrogenase family)
VVAVEKLSIWLAKLGPVGNLWWRIIAQPRLLLSPGLNLTSAGINANTLALGVVDGAHWDGVDARFAKYENLALGEKNKQVGAAVPLGRMDTANDSTGMAVFLASSEADCIVAKTFNVDGGNWMS